MSSPTSTRTLQECKSCGGGAPVDVHFCPQCEHILALGRHGNYFSFLGLSRRLNLDLEDLERRFRTLSRQFHPDFFYNATPAERRASLERSSYLNDAYRTLKDPVTRLEYLLGLEGFAPRDAAQVPASLLEEVFALNEELDEIRAMRTSGASTEALKARLEHAERPIYAKRSGHEHDFEELSARWDAIVQNGGDEGVRKEVLTALREKALERNYINNLLSGIERELNA